MEISAEAGVDSIEHGAYADETALSSMVQMGTIWVPTVSTIANLRGKGRFAEQAVTAILETATENIRHFVRLGGILAPGSDAGAWAVPHGADCEASILAEILGDEAFPVLARGADLVKQKF
jgi:imidazolonepropionase-like amidohydrolase